MCVRSHNYSIHTDMIVIVIMLLYLCTQRGNSALHLACKLGLVDIVRNLCGFNADASLQNKKVCTNHSIACLVEHVWPVHPSLMEL